MYSSGASAGYTNLSHSDLSGKALFCLIVDPENCRECKTLKRLERREYQRRSTFQGSLFSPVPRVVVLQIDRVT
jgi:hypothetical protein